MLRPKLNRLWGGDNSATRRDPGDTKYIQGWISEIPTFQVLNYLQYKMDTTMLAQGERGMFEWGGDIDYVKGALAWDELDKQIYVSQVQNPSKTLAPSKNLAQWKTSSIQITRQDFDTITSAINAHIADVTGNPHKLTPGRLGAYTKAETDALVTTYRNLVAAHVGDKNNPHAVTATQIGAVPVTGGTYTGDVIFATGQILLDAASTNKVGLLSGNGLYLQAANGLIGVNAAGVAVAGTAASNSPIVTEKTFADQKAKVEPDYAAPAPVFYMPLMGDINIYTGAGACDYPSTLQWNTSGFKLLNGIGGQLTLSNPLLVGTTNVTVAIDIVGSGSNASSQLFHIGVGDSATPGMCRIGCSGGGTVIGYGGTDSITANGKFDGKTHRCVLRKSASGTDMFIDGVLVGSGGNAPIPIATTTECLYASTSLTAAVAVSLCNFRVWSSALSNKQISNL